MDSQISADAAGILDTYVTLFQIRNWKFEPIGTVLEYEQGTRRNGAKSYRSTTISLEEVHHYRTKKNKLLGVPQKFANCGDLVRLR